MSILFIQKSETPEGTFSTDQVLQKFLDAKSVDEIKPYVERATDRLYVTWASVEGRDKDGQRIPIDDVINEQDKLLRRNAPISDMHTNRHVGQTLAYKVLQHPVTGTLGVLHLNKIWGGDLANPVDDKVWKETQLGIRQGSSVGGINEDTSYMREKDGRVTEVLEGFHQYETANVYRGANPWAYNEAVSVVAKSASDVKNDDQFFNKVWSILEKNSTGGITKTTLQTAFTQASATPGEVLFKVDDVQKPFAGYDNFEACVKANSDKEDPQAYCATIMRSVEKSTSVESIKKTDHLKVVGDPMTPEEVQKFDTLTKSVDEKINALSTSVAKTAEAVELIAKSLEELKKSQVSKDEAASEIPGEGQAKVPESPAPEKSNEAEVYKARNEELKKQLEDAQAIAKSALDIKKYSTPRPGQSVPQESKTDVRKMALDLALGKTKGDWNQVNKAVRDLTPATPVSLIMQTRVVSQ